MTHDFAKETAASTDNRPLCPAAERDRVERDDRVDEASKDSFPASDPPSRWAGKDEPPPTLNGE